jgi:hypothetical protein
MIFSFATSQFGKCVVGDYKTRGSERSAESSTRTSERNILSKEDIAAARFSSDSTATLPRW